VNKSNHQGFNAGPINRFMRLPNASALVAAIAFGFCAISMLSSGDLHFDSASFAREISMRWRGILFFSTIFAFGGWWTARTWQKFWRYGRSKWERAVYDSGVRGYGFIMAVSLIFIISWLGWTADAGALFGPMMSLGTLAGIFFGVPVGLHLGYIWGSGFAVIANAEHDKKLEIGEPPCSP